jgi:alpha-tubulin suppressor-like RCC1 family protein
LALGNSNEVDAGQLNPVPTAVSVLGGKTITDIAVAQNATHVCAIVQGEGIYCWGFNSFGQIGHATGAGTPPDIGTSNPTPQLVANTSLSTSVAVAQSTSCGATSAGTAGCWGANSNGAFGNGQLTPAFTSTPVSAANGQATISTIVGGGASESAVFCSIANSGQLTCWGETGYGEVGNGTYNSLDGGSPGMQCNNDYCTDSPQTLPMAVKQVSIGFTQSLALGVDGKVYGWGLNRAGQLGHTPGQGDAPNCFSASSGSPSLVAPVGPCNATPTVISSITP